MEGRPQSRRGRQRLQMLAQQQRQARRRWSAISASAIVVLLLGGSAVYAAFVQGAPRNQSAAQPGGAIDGVACQPEMLNYHIHAALTLYRDGRRVMLPANIGIPISTAIDQNGQNYCLYWLHTHEFDHAAGIIHIESPSPQTYTLGRFFDIWRATARWDADGGLGASVDGSFVEALRKAKMGAIHAYEDGRPYTASYRSITLTAHKLITIEIGVPIKQPTAHLVFPNGE